MLELYPDNPALGSPFGTGNETFGAGMEYKRAAAMLTDLSFTSLRRNWTQTTSAEGVPAFGYIFADQHAALQDPSLGGQSMANPLCYAILMFVFTFIGVAVSDPFKRAHLCLWLRGGKQPRRLSAAIESVDGRLLDLIRCEHDPQRWKGHSEYVAYFSFPYSH